MSMREAIVWKMEKLSQEFSLPLDPSNPFAGQHRREEEILFAQLGHILDCIDTRHELSYWNYSRLVEIVQEYLVNNIQSSPIYPGI